MKTLLCWILGHEPTIERRGDDSVMICTRCNKPVDYEDSRLIVKDNVFVKNLYKGK